MKKLWNSPMKRKGGQLLIGVLAALAFILVIYYANHDRPVYKEGDTSGTSYEIGKVVGILEDNVTVDHQYKSKGSQHPNEQLATFPFHR